VSIRGSLSKEVAMVERSKVYAVLTGDIVGSSRLPPPGLPKLMQRLREGAERFSEAFPGAVLGKTDVFGGDGWQMLMPDWKRSLRAAIYMRAVAKSTDALKTDSRVAIAWGTVDVESLNPERISESTGEAFTRSGRALKTMRKQARLVLDAGDESGEWRFLRTSVALVDELASRWTARQAETVAMALLGRSQEGISSVTGKCQPTVQQSLRTAGWRGIDDLLKELEYRPQSL
jgi:hypothetical protein